MRVDSRTDSLAEAVLLGGKRFEFKQTEVVNLKDFSTFARAQRKNGELQFEIETPNHASGSQQSEPRNSL